MPPTTSCRSAGASAAAPTTPTATPAFDNEGNVKGFAFINAMYNEHKIIPQGRGRQRRHRVEQQGVPVGPGGVHQQPDQRLRLSVDRGSGADEEDRAVRRAGRPGGRGQPDRHLVARPVQAVALSGSRQGPCRVLHGPRPLQRGHRQQQRPLRAGLSRTCSTIRGGPSARSSRSSSRSPTPACRSATRRRPRPLAARCWRPT